MRQHPRGALLGRGGRGPALAAVGAVAASLVLASPVGAGGKAGFGCSPGFDLGEVTLEQTLELPRIQAGVAAGSFTESDITALFEAIDHNGDGLLCFQDLGALTGASHWQYFYNGVDNNASVRGG